MHDRFRKLQAEVIIVLATSVLLGCGGAKKDPPGPTMSVEDKVYETESVRLKGFTHQGFVVTLHGTTPTNLQNSLLFTSIAEAALTCEDGLYLTAAEQTMLTSTGGSLYHHPSIPNQMDFDDAIGFYRGASERMRHCGPSEVTAWLPGLKLHQSIIPTINTAGGVKLDYPFTWIPSAVFNQAGIGPAPSDSEQADMEAAVATWAAVDVAAKAACYRLHLGLQVLQTIEATGHKVSANGRNAFCDVTNGTGIPTLDRWCGRGDLKGWVDGFQDNVWQYRHQRCAAWEKPDGNGDQQPSVDALIGYRDLMTGEE